MIRFFLTPGTYSKNFESMPEHNKIMFPCHGILDLFNGLVEKFDIFSASVANKVVVMRTFGRLFKYELPVLALDFPCKSAPVQYVKGPVNGREPHVFIFCPHNFVKFASCEMVFHCKESLKDKFSLISFP